MVVVCDLEADLFGGALLCEVGLLDPEARILLSLAVGALICVKSVLWTSEAGLFCCALFGEVGLINLKARD